MYVLIQYMLSITNREGGRGRGRRARIKDKDGIGKDKDRALRRVKTGH